MVRLSLKRITKQSKSMLRRTQIGYNNVTHVFATSPYSPRIPRTHLWMLITVWPVLSFVVSIVQLLALSQPEWIVRGTTSMGLFALCSPTSCLLREGTVLPVLALFGGSVLFLLSSLALIPCVLCTRRSTPLRWIANTQFVAAILCGITVVIVPFEMGDVECTMPELLRSTTCRIGWAYAASSVASLLSMCCPVIGRLVAEERSFDYALVTPEFNKNKEVESQEFYF